MSKPHEAFTCASCHIRYVLGIALSPAPGEVRVRPDTIRALRRLANEFDQASAVTGETYSASVFLDYLIPSLVEPVSRITVDRDTYRRRARREEAA